MIMMSVALCSVVHAFGQAAIPARVVEPWVIEVGPGTVTVEGRAITVPQAVRVAVPPPAVISIADECYAELPVFDNTAGGWRKGARLRALIAEECTATGLLFPDSVRVKPAPGDAPPFKQDVDYAIDLFWGTFGRIEGGAILGKQYVYVDYRYSPSRLDTVAATADGKVRLVPGKPAIALAMLPLLDPGETAVVNVWTPGRTEKLTDENLFPIDFAPPVVPEPAEPVAARLLPKTLAKLRAGEPLTVVAFGDSVTHGGGVDGHEDLWYQNQFAQLLRKRFPQARIRLLTAAWPGAGSKMYLDAPRGGPYDFVRDVLDPKPDLVTIEFVNDAYLDETGTAAHYGGILAQLRGVGAEVILIAPHLVRPDWMNATSLTFDEDPRPYVRGLRQFAAANHVALAEASREWCRLWRRGIPYITLLANDINHPDVRGHAIFADALLALFPPS